jgi:AsmA protein
MAAGGALEGSGSATLAVEGRADAPAIAKALEGQASVEIRDGALKSVGLLRQVASTLEKAGGRGIGKDETPFETMAASFALKDGLARTDDLRVRSADLDLDGQGAIDLAGPLRLDVRTAFSPESSAMLVARTPQLKIRVGEDGRLTIPMKLRGTIESPRVEIDVDKLLEEGLRDQLREKKQGLLKRLLGR